MQASNDKVPAVVLRQQKDLELRRRMRQAAESELKRRQEQEETLVI